MPPVMLIAMARAIRPSFVVGLALSAGLGCAGLQPVKEPPPTTELELAYDSGPASERPLLPQASFEWLIKFEPNLPAYQPHRLRLLVAQPGAMRLTLYAADAAGRPGETLRTLERTYTPEQTSNGQDGKWLLEPLFDLSRQTGAMFVGISVPNPGFSFRCTQPSFNWARSLNMPYQIGSRSGSPCDSTPTPQRGQAATR